jgi:hypothetical protein
MSVERRDGQHANGFAHAIRSVSGGGTIPDEWECRVVDLDRLYTLINESEPIAVRTEGRLWGWYRVPLELIALAELKSPRDLQQSWAVTQALALQASLPGFRVLAHDNGTVDVTDLGGVRTRYPSPREFIEGEIRPLFWAAEFPF